MQRTRISLALAGATALALLGCLACSQPAPPPVQVLMIAAGEGHGDQNRARRLAKRLTGRGDVAIELAADPRRLNRDDLTSKHVLLFSVCTQEELAEPVCRAILEEVRSGTGLVAMGGSLASFRSWPAWADMLGGTGSAPAEPEPHTLTVLDPHHAAMLGLGGSFSIADCPYRVDDLDPGADVLIRATRDREGPQVHQDSEPIPVVWARRYGEGRVLVVTLGADQRCWDSEEFILLLHNGIRWASGRRPDTPHNVLAKSERDVGFELLFNGHDLDGWSGDMRNWSVENGELVGRARDLGRNIFATYRRPYGDFLLRFSVKLVGGNSGVQFRSEQYPGYVVKGYQADAAPGEWGNLYDEGTGRHVLADGFTGKAEKVVRQGGWNDVTVRAVGPKITITVNGLETVKYTEPDPDRPREGVIALQLHRGPPMEVRFRDIRIRPLAE